MKVGILTFHRAQNYGALLQCYALQKVLMSLGHDVEVVDYRPAYIKESYSIFSLKRIKEKKSLERLKLLIREILLIPIKYIRNYRFNTFINRYLKLSPELFYNDIPSDYDVYVVGSDQIWNKAITNGFDNIFFCDFDFDKGIKKYISYAASMEAVNMDTADLTYLNEKLKTFDAISVREDVVAEFLSQTIKDGVIKVLDPTLLLHGQSWHEIIPLTQRESDYIVLYQARYSSRLLSIAKALAQNMNCELIEMTSWTIPVSRMFKAGMNASPECFLNFIRNAKLVINTSFHGTAFSIIFGVPFYYVSLDDGWDVRATSLLKELNLMDRAKKLEEMSGLVPNVDCDFDEANVRLESLRKDSISFLTDNLK